MCNWCMEKQLIPKNKKVKVCTHTIVKNGDYLSELFVWGNNSTFMIYVITYISMILWECIWDIMRMCCDNDNLEIVSYDWIQV